MKVKVFVKPGCPKCPKAKELAEKIGAEVHDISTVDGLAEATFYGVLSTPSVLVVDGDEVVAAWHGEVPEPGEVEKLGGNKGAD